MKYERPKKRRPYRMSARAEASKATGDRVLEAATRLFGARPYDDVSLDDVAVEAGVTVQTLLRRHGSKEGLVDAAAALGLEQVRSARSEAEVGDLAAAIANLSEHYEAWGERSLRFLAQEERVPAMRRVTDAGRALHRAWVERVFAPWIARRRGAARTRLSAQLVAITDVYVWKILRRDRGLDAAATRRALHELVESIVD